MKTGAFAKSFRSTASAALLFTCAVTGPAAARAQFAQGEAPASRVAVDRNFLIGTWSNAGDCSVSVDFTADGLYATADGAEGQWSLAGDTLILTGAGGTRTLTIIPIDRDTMEVIAEDGAHDRSTRCAGAFGEQRIA